VTPWTATLERWLQGSTTHGYTGHEMAESVGVIHMNGRIYDPHFARFLQADPFVQDPQDLQSWNRYSYVLNNPMSYMDPTGYFSVGDLLRTAAAVAITVYSGGAAAGSWGFLGMSAGLDLAGVAIRLVATPPQHALRRWAVHALRAYSALAAARHACRSERGFAGWLAGLPPPPRSAPRRRNARTG
jgi:RHS repeat-associated protein